MPPRILHLHAVLPSAADQAVALAREGAPAGTLVVARTQSAGRGRAGHRWVSPEGGVYLGLVLRPRVPMQCLMAVQPCAQLGVLDALRGRGVEGAALGWPNDLLLGDAKLGCVTVDAGVGEGVYAVIGVNLNVAWSAALGDVSETGDFCAEHPLPVAALGEELAEEQLVDLAEVLAEAIMARMATYEADVAARRAQAGPLQPFLSEYFDAIPLLGEYVRASYSDGRVAALGHFVGIDIWDRVTVRDKAGTEHEFAQEQASLRPLPQD